jgi:hypothetical protein
MGKATLGFLLAGAYALGLGILLVIGLSLPGGTLSKVRCALGQVPDFGHRALHLVRVAAHAGALGMSHLPAALEPQGESPHRRSMRFCTREPSSGCGSSLAPIPGSSLGPVLPVVVRLVVRNDG